MTAGPFLQNGPAFFRDTAEYNLYRQDIMSQVKVSFTDKFLVSDLLEHLKVFPLVPRLKKHG